MILPGDLFAVLPTIAAESFDACVTDPPYGIGFMGREWDTFKPEVANKKQGLRQINKSESYTRQQKRQINPNLKGRTVDGAISASQIEYDYTADGLRGFQGWTAKWAAEVLRVLKPGAYIVVCGAPRSHHRMMCGLEDAGFVVRDCFAWLFGSGFPKNKNLGDGRGTALKPAHEPIALAWKPFKGTISANVARHGTGALNIDACRIGWQSDADKDSGKPASWPKANESIGTFQTKDRSHFNPDEKQSDLGRWPANVLLDEDAAALLDKQTGDLISGANPTRRGSDKFRDTYGEFKGQAECDAARGVDVGGASRFYYVAKPSREERDCGTYGLTERARDESREPGKPGGDNPRNRGVQPRGNFHPTVKPLALMRWLVKLVTPPGGRVLDPFGGSGTTGMACAAENIAFTLIEREPEYIAIIEARIRSVAPLFSEEAAI